MSFNMAPDGLLTPSTRQCFFKTYYCCTLRLARKLSVLLVIQ